MNLLCSLLAVFILNLHALPFDKLQVGAAVELTQDVDANKKLSNAMLMCRIGFHAVYPRIKIGPTAGENGAEVHYFRVAAKRTDPFTYHVELMSEQLPCGCTLALDQSPGYVNGYGPEYRMLGEVKDTKAMTDAPSLPTACGNLPGWVNPATSQSLDDEDGLEI